MTHHVLKTDPAVFRASRDGSKNFEVRKDDRAFQKGDTIDLIYNDPGSPPVSAPWIAQQAPLPRDPKDDLSPVQLLVTFVLRGGQYGIEPGYVVLSTQPRPAVQK